LWTYGDSLDVPAALPERLLTLDPKGRLSAHPKFSAWLDSVSDAGLWFNTANLDGPGLLRSLHRIPRSVSALPLLTTENIFTAIVDFTPGVAKLHWKLDPSAETRRWMEAYLGKQPGRIQARLFDPIPGDHLLFLGALSVDLPRLLDRLETDAEADSLIGPQVKRWRESMSLLGLERNELLTLLRGDFALGLMTTSAESASPRAVLTAGIGNPQAFTRLLSLVTRYGVVEQKGNVYVVGERLGFAVRNNVLTIGWNAKAAVDAAAIGRKPSLPTDPALVQRAGAYAYWGRLDVPAFSEKAERILASRPHAQSELKHAGTVVKSWEIRGTTYEGDCVLELTNKIKNSLRVLIEEYPYSGGNHAR
jgi:hypothetical protein